MVTKFIPFCLIAFMPILHVSAQQTNELKEKVLHEWSKNEFPIDNLKQGIYFEVYSPKEGKCTVHLGNDYLHAETDKGILVYTKKCIFGLMKRNGGFSLIQISPNESMGGKEAKIQFSKQTIAVQEKMGPVFTQLFPVEPPDFFNYLIPSFMPSYRWLAKNPFVEIKSVIAEKGGLINITYIKNSTKQYGEGGNWAQYDLKIDPNTAYNVVSEEWKSLNPKYNASVSSSYKYQSFDGQIKCWALAEFNKTLSENDTKAKHEKIEFKNFKTQPFDHAKLDISFYGILEQNDANWPIHYYYILWSLIALVLIIVSIKYVVPRITKR